MGFGPDACDSLLVCAAGNGSLGGDDHDFAVTAGPGRGPRAGFHHAHHGQGREMLAQGGQGRRRGGIAGHHQHLRASVHQLPGGQQSIAGDGLPAFGAVRQPGRIAQIEQILAGQAVGQGLEHSKAAHA